MKKVSDNLPLFTVIILYFAYCNIFYYYNEFEINIFNYISGSEILSTLFTKIVFVSSAIVFLLVIITYSLLLREARKEEASLKSKKEKSPAIFLLIGIYWIQYFLIMYLFEKLLHYNKYTLQKVSSIESLIFLLTIAYVILYSMGTIIRNNTTALMIISAAVIIYAGNLIGNNGKHDAEFIKDGNSATRIIFKYRDNLISTNKSLIYIGQTQSHIFLFNRIDTSTTIYKMSEIDSLILK